MKDPGSAVLFTALGIGIGLSWQIVRGWWSSANATLDELLRLDIEGDVHATRSWCIDCGAEIEYTEGVGCGSHRYPTATPNRLGRASWTDAGLERRRQLLPAAGAEDRNPAATHPADC